MAYYTCVIKDLSPRATPAVGSFHQKSRNGFRLDFHPEVYTAEGDGGAASPSYFTIHMNVPYYNATDDIYEPGDYTEKVSHTCHLHQIAVKLGSSSFTITRVMKLSTTTSELPRDIQAIRNNTQLFGSLWQISVDWNNTSLFSEGLMNTVPTTAISGSESEDAILAFRDIFQRQSGKFDLYVVDSRSDTFKHQVTRLQETQVRDLSKPLTCEFYAVDEEIPNPNHPVFIFENLANTVRPRHERPTAPFNNNIAYANIDELCTRKGLASIEIYQAELEDVSEVKATETRMWAFPAGDGRGIEFVGVAQFSKHIDKKFGEGDVLWLAIDPKTFDTDTTNNKWRAMICPRESWMKGDNIICFKFIRPLRPSLNSPLDLKSTQDIASYTNYDLPIFQRYSDWLLTTAGFAVQIQCEVSDVTAKTQINGVTSFHLSGRENLGHYLAGNKLTSSTNLISMEANFCCWKNGIPDEYENLLEQGAVELLMPTFGDEDHQAVLEYLQNVPDGRGIINGPPGTGKTFMLAEIVAATHAAQYFGPSGDDADGRGSYLKSVVVVPSNHPADVAARDIQQSFKRFAYLGNEYVLRPLPSSRVQHESLSGTSYAQIEIQSMTNFFINNLREPDKSSDEMSDAEELDDAPQSPHACFSKETLAERRHQLFQLLSVLKTWRDIGRTTDPLWNPIWAEKKTEDLKLTVAFQALCLTGFTGNISREGKVNANQIFPRNPLYTIDRPAFNDLLDRFARLDRKNFDKEDCKALAYHMETVFDYTVGKAAVLVSTPATLSNDLYVRNFKFTKLNMYLDEAGKLVFCEYASAFSLYRPQIRVFFGDIKQGKPIVTDEDRCPHARAELKTSIMEEMLRVYWPSVTLTYNRRSAQGIIDIPSNMFYKSQLLAHPALSVDYMNKHIKTQAWTDFVNTLFPTSRSAPVKFVEAQTDTLDEVGEMSRSKFNPQNAALIINTLILAIGAGFKPEDFVVIAMYNDQVKLIRKHLRELTIADPNLYRGLRDTLILSVDAFQGGGGKIVMIDFVAKQYTGFLNESGRLNVALTRAIDGGLVTLSPPTLENRRRGTINWPTVISEEAEKLGIKAKVQYDSPLLVVPDPVQAAATRVRRPSQTLIIGDEAHWALNCM